MVMPHDRELTDDAVRRAVDVAPDGILVADVDGTIAFVNPMAASMFGYEEHELIGMKVEELVPRDLRGAHEAHRTSYVDRPRTRPMGSGLDLRGVRRSGEEFPVEISLSPATSEGRRLVVAIVRDVTDRRHAADELMQAHEELALADDRERIARDLHDTVIQRLFAVGLSLQSFLTRAPDTASAERIQVAIDEIDATIREIRTAIFSLHTRHHAAAGVRDEVLTTAREAARALGFEPRVSFEGPVDAAITAALREQVVPALREALSNVAKHAQAAHVDIALTVNAEALTLQVRDDGIGSARSDTGGRGLANLAERAQALGGSSDVRSPAGRGTTIVWSVPLRLG